MESTLTLRSIRQPNGLEQLLHDLVYSTGVLPDGAFPLCDLGDMPRAVAQIVRITSSAGESWTCLSHDGNVWLFVAEMLSERSFQIGLPVLQLDLYREDGKRNETSRWIRDCDGKWRRFAD
jgi:hypothetical protein